VPSTHDKTHATDKNDAGTLRALATWLRVDPQRAGRAAGVSGDDARALAALLDLLAAEVAHVDRRIRLRAVRSCRAALTNTSEL